LLELKEEVLLIPVQKFMEDWQMHETLDPMEQSSEEILLMHGENISSKRDLIWLD
jgi:hypothetical protein